jgi:putative glutamine amidotransferase
MRIGLTYTGTEWKHENYVRWLRAEENGIEVVRLEAGGDASMVGYDGLVLSGGVDIMPAFYGGSTAYSKAPAEGWQPVRDEFELKVLDMAFHWRLPVLGVCRGLQLINVYLKGTLVQDLGLERDTIHENDAGVDKQHLVVVDEGSLLGGIVGMSQGVANSAHHQAVDRLGADLRVNCRAEDGTIEGLEWVEPAGRPFLLAVQWHPERMYVNGLRDVFLYREIRDRFITEIKMNKK